MKIKTEFYTIKALTNLHMGSGEGQFSVIDKQVQRDVLTKLPTMHGSGLKGAMREHFEYQIMQSKSSVSQDTPSKEVGTDTEKRPDLELIFGGKPKDSVKRQGAYKFFDGNLLSIPVRSSHHFYFMATCPRLLKDTIDNLSICNAFSTSEIKNAFDELIKIYTESDKSVYFCDAEISDLRLEDTTELEYAKKMIPCLSEIMGERLVVLSDELFSKDFELPVVARNYLENGKSENLWYEEFVPRKTRFLTMIQRPDTTESKYDLSLETKIQFGANATVGYGLCEVKKVQL